MVCMGNSDLRPAVFECNVYLTKQQFNNLHLLCILIQICSLIMYNQFINLPEVSLVSKRESETLRFRGFLKAMKKDLQCVSIVY